MSEDDFNLIQAGTKALTEALGAEKATAFLALVNPGVAQGAIEPPPTAPAKDGVERDLFVSTRSASIAAGLDFAFASHIADVALTAFRNGMP